nr:MAG TPA: hypothetical protein [Caudoviricetes sp.]
MKVQARKGTYGGRERLRGGLLGRKSGMGVAGICVSARWWLRVLLAR